MSEGQHETAQGVTSFPCNHDLPDDAGLARPQSQSVTFDEDLGCDHCGRFGAFGFDGRSLCGECYQLQGACCAEREDGNGTCSGPNPESAK